MKYPIGIQDFDNVKHDGYAYVDKTALMYKMMSLKAKLKREIPANCSGSASTSLLKPS